MQYGYPPIGIYVPLLVNVSSCELKCLTALIIMYLNNVPSPLLHVSDPPPDQVFADP